MKGWALILSASALLAACAHKPAPTVEHILPWYKDMPAADSEDIDSSSDVAKIKRIAPFGLPVIHFGFDDDRLVPSEWTALLDLALYAKGNCTISGHASPEGDASYNLALGHRRAQAVLGYLTSANVPASFGVISFGAEKPLDGGDTGKYWMDRRVEVACP